NEALALVLTRQDARIVGLGTAGQLSTACEALELQDVRKEAGAALESLAKLVIEPLKVPAGVKRLLISPEGPLSYVPFAALAPDRTVAYVQSGTTYGFLQPER